MSDNMDEPERPENIVNYNSKLVGVTFEGRQDVIKVLHGSEPLRVRREKDNKYDSKAVAVDVLFGEEWAPVGYIAKDKNEKIAAVLDAGKEVYIAMSSITGGGDKSFGINVKIEYVWNGDIQPAKQEIKEAIDNFVVAKTPEQELFEAALKFAKEVSGEKSTTRSYKSRLIGKSTEVQVHNGHIALDGYLSGSKFPKQFYPEFNQEEMLQKILDKYFEDDKKPNAKYSILSMWDINREASTSFGRAIHSALENYDTYYKLGDKIKTVKVLKTKTNTGPNKALSRNPFLKKIVEDFDEKFGGDYVRLNEQFIWAHEEKLCGAIDRVKVIDADKKIIRIQDFKTDGDIHEKTYQKNDSIFYPLTQGKDATLGKELLDLHWLQLSFYAYILIKYYGYTVEGLDVYWLNPNKLIKGENAWEEFSHDVIDIKGALNV